MPFTSKYKADLIELINSKLDNIIVGQARYYGRIISELEHLCIHHKLQFDTTEVTNALENVTDLFIDCELMIHASVLNNSTLFQKDGHEKTLEHHKLAAKTEYFALLSERVNAKAAEMRKNYRLNRRKRTFEVMAQQLDVISKKAEKRAALSRTLENYQPPLPGSAAHTVDHYTWMLRETVRFEQEQDDEAETEGYEGDSDVEFYAEQNEDIYNMPLENEPSPRPIIPSASQFRTPYQHVVAVANAAEMANANQLPIYRNRVPAATYIEEIAPESSSDAVANVEAVAEEIEEIQSSAPRLSCTIL